MKRLPAKYLKLLQGAFYLGAGFFLFQLLLDLNTYTHVVANFIVFVIKESGLLLWAIGISGDENMVWLLLITVPPLIQSGVLGIVTGLPVGYWLRDTLCLKLFLLGAIFSLLRYSLVPSYYFLSRYGSVVASELSLQNEGQHLDMDALSAATLMAKEILLAKFCMGAFFLIFVFVGRKLYFQRDKKMRAIVVDIIPVEAPKPTVE